MSFQGRNRFNADGGAGARGNPADFGASASFPQRAGFGSEQNPNATGNQAVLSSAPAGNPHSSRGFRQALEKTQRPQSRLKDQLPDANTFGGRGFKKPNYFAQGGARHGMHIGSGAPYTGQDQGGSDFGGQ